MRERLERMLGQTARAIWILTFHAACGRMLRREARAARLPLHVHDLRRPGPGAARQGVPRGAREGSEALLAARHPRADLAREERARLAGGVRELASRRSGTRPSPRRTSCTSAACTPRTPSTSTTCSCSRCRSSSASPRRSSAGGRRSATSSSTSTRTRTTRSTACCSSWAASTGTCAPSATRTSRSTASAAADIRNILEFEKDFPGTQVVTLEQNYRSTNTILRAANALIEQNTRAQAEAALLRPRRGRPGARDRGRGRARGGALRRRRDRVAHRRAATRRARSRSSTG